MRQVLLTHFSRPGSVATACGLGDHPRPQGLARLETQLAEALGGVLEAPGLGDTTVLDGEVTAWKAPLLFAQGGAR
jgi:hypothetical protein